MLTIIYVLTLCGALRITRALLHNARVFRLARTSIWPVALAVTGIAAASAALVAAPSSWVSVTSPHFTVISTGGEGAGRSLAWQFEQIRSATHQAWPWIGDRVDRPMVVVGAKGESTMHALVPQYWEKGAGLHPTSVFVSAPDRHWMIVRSDVEATGPEGVNPYSQAYWSYGAVALESSGHQGLPLWWITGFREVISNINIFGGEIQIGRTMPDHVRRLNQYGTIALADFFRVTAGTPELKQEEFRWDYDAECWLLVQFLVFGGVDAQKHAANVNQLAGELLKGRSSAEIVTEVFGSVDNLQYALRAFLKEGVFRYATAKANAAIDSKSFTVKPLSMADELATRARLHAAMNRPDDARLAAEAAATADPASPAPAEVEGLVFDQAAKPSDAQSAFEKAVTAGSTNFYVLYRLGQMLWTPAADDAVFARIEHLALQSTTSNDAYAPAQDLLANVRLRLREAGAAIPPARRVIELQPDSAFYRLTLAEAVGTLGSKADAVQLIQAALPLATSEAERQRAQQLMARFGS